MHAAVGVEPALSRQVNDEALLAQRQVAARLERLPITATQLRARLIVGMATLFDGYDSIMLGLVMPVLKMQWHLSTAQTGVLFSGTFAGQFLGAMLFPYIAERLGRLRAVSYSVWVLSVFSLVAASTWNFASMAAARFVQGIGLGGQVPVAATYMNEIARARGRGRFFLLYEAAFGVGIIISTLVGLLLIPNFGWRSMFIIGALPAFIAIGLRRLVPESPRWLASQGRMREADAVIARMEQEAESKLGHPLPAADPAAVPAPLAGMSRLTELFSARYRSRTLVLWSIWSACFFVTTSINQWLPTLYKEQLHLSVQQALGFTLAGYSITIIGSLAVAFLIDKTGRRLWIGNALLLGGISMLVLAWLGASNPYRLLGFAAFTHLAFATVSVSIYMYTTELYPTRMRALGTGMGSVMRNVFATLSPIMVALVLQKSSLSGVFMMIGLVPLIPALLVLRFGVETRNRVLEELSP